jgi:hypothetical protein
MRANSGRFHVTAVAATATLSAFLAPAHALAAAGGGRAGTGDLEEGAPTVFGLVLGLLLLVALLAAVPLGARFLRRRRERLPALPPVASAAVGHTAAEARLAVHTIRGEADALFREVQAAWDAGDEDRLSDLLDADLLERWRPLLRRPDSEWWTDRVKASGPVDVQLVDAGRRGSTGEPPFAVVRVQACLHGSIAPARRTSNSTPHPFRPPPSGRPISGDAS